MRNMPSPQQTRDRLAAFASIHIVDSFEQLLAAPFSKSVNAICWARELEGDFDEIVRAAGPLDEITGLDEEDLESLELSPAGRQARETLIQDLRLLENAELAPNLDIIPAYPRDLTASPVPVDVYDFHADSATILADTFLCSYTESASEGVRNEDAIRYVDVPEIRAQLLANFGGTDDEAFAAYLKERFFDLHYAAREGAPIYNFGVGNLWRIATQCPDSPALPCIHRAPSTQPGNPARLLLIS